MISQDRVEKIWKIKLAAYLHDPATKALILMRGIGHEEGSIKRLKKKLFGNASEWEEIEKIVKKADQWASAADRPQLPMNTKTRIVFADRPELIHPLTGEVVRIDTLSEDSALNPEVIEGLNFSHFEELILKTDDGESTDWERTFLSFWRLGRESAAPGLGVLWQNLPADTRCPDHSIWDHLNLTSAFAGALAGSKNGNISLFLMSFGPVQGFIAQARSVSDLWAGSHLLSSVTWKAIKVICNRFGPDAVIFPVIHSVPIVDVWLVKEKGISGISLNKRSSDANPLFSAALPNRFMAIIPQGLETQIVDEIKTSLRDWISQNISLVLNELSLLSAHAKAQIDRQLKDFPEIYWSSVPWSLGGSIKLQDDQLKNALEQLGASRDYLDSNLAKLMDKTVSFNGSPFFVPNPGVAYPGIYELTERVHGTAKTARSFTQTREKGYRCSICGEREWLSAKEKQLMLPPGKRQKEETPWTKLFERQKNIKKGEHLCGLCAFKRFWPRLFLRDIEETVLEDKRRLNRYVVSTHTISLAVSIWNNLQQNGLDSNQNDAKDELKKEIKRLSLDRVALPKKLYENLKKIDQELLDFYGKLPALLDSLEDETLEGRKKIEKNIKKLFGKEPEKYYAFILMDGDEMGKWVAGEASEIKIKDRFHSEIVEELRTRPELSSFLEASRPNSPAWHQTISVALNNFSVKVARLLVEDVFMGKLIYAGGDDLLAMVAVHDLPALMLALRICYSGHSTNEKFDLWKWLTNNTIPNNIKIKTAKGFGLIVQGKQKELIRLIGPKATASIGAVVAHNKTPLTKVLGELRLAEKRAKQEGGRDSFSITLMKRSGGTTYFTSKWSIEKESILESYIGLLLRTRDLLASEGVSRRAAYLLCEILRDCPPELDTLATVIGFQLRKQGAKEKEAFKLGQALARSAVELTSKNSLVPQKPEWALPNKWIRDFLIIAEFLAREGRAAQGTLEEKA